MVSVVTAQIEEKAKRVLPLAPVPVRRADVHKQFRENVFLSSITPGTDEAGQAIYLAEVRVISDHPYFFEHSRDHLPGLYIIEAGRQLGLAIPHLFYDVGYDYGFVLEGCDMRFSGFINLTDSLFIECRIFNPVYRRGKLQSLSFDGTFLQSGQACVQYQSHIKLIHRKLLARYERHSG